MKKTTVMTVTAQDLADFLEDMDAAIAADVTLPEADKARKFCYAGTTIDAGAWSWWVEKFENTDAFLGMGVDGGEFVAYKLEVDGKLCTLVLFSWSQGGFDGPALVDGHPETIEEAGIMWLGVTEIDEQPEGHPIHEVMK